VLYDTPLKMKDPQPATGSVAVEDLCSVEIKSDKCFRYTARVIQGVKIGPSPDWLQKRLTAIGVEPVNNVVDATNYVMFEIGQPLHAFDFGKINGNKIIVREANKDEQFVAIDHKTYALDPAMCMIADADNAVAIGGVMGGADSEISQTTADVLIEAAWFDQLSVRKTARRLNLQSPSSFRFERNVDSQLLDWASRRCCEIILETAGGTLACGVIDVGKRPDTPPKVTLRYAQLKGILGIEIPADTARKILSELGLGFESSDNQSLTVSAPSWRKDLTREVDLIEEVGRIYGFDKVPDTAPVPMAASYRPKADRSLDRVRAVLLGAGFDEAMTPSLVPELWSNTFSPWTEHPPLKSSQPMLGVLEKASQNIGSVDLLRRSLVPSLLEARRINEFRSNTDIELFETAKVYLPVKGQPIPDQPAKVSFVSGKSYAHVKGVVEAIVGAMSSNSQLSIANADHDLLDPDQSGQLSLDAKTLGFIGKASQSAKKLFRLRSDATFAELDLGVLNDAMVPIVLHANQSSFPPISRDFNFVLENDVKWDAVETTVRSNGGDLLEAVSYRETFRDEKKDGKTKKRLLLTVTLRSADSTLTGEQADAVCKAIIDGCQRDHDAALLG
jgi:phenylalanyl-tRNA synthetase beta chain